MTAVEWLYDQLDNELELYNSQWLKIEKIVEQAKEMEKQQQDDFAIGFAEWNSYKYKYLPNKGWFGNSYELEMGIFKSSKQLLEIYKKECNL
jgi:hypothetical protein